MSIVIGIIGGMGPRATVAFEQVLIDRFPGTDQNIPTIVTINNGSIPDRSSFVLGYGPSPICALQESVSALESLNVDVLCMPCNSAHIPRILDEITIKSPLLHMPKLTIKFAQEYNVRHALLLATSGTVKSRMYQKLAQAEGFICHEPDAITQKLVTGIIAAIKVGNLVKASRLTAMVRCRIAHEGFDAIILGCTELTLVADSLSVDGTEIINTLDVLASAVVEYTKQLEEIKL